MILKLVDGFLHPQISAFIRDFSKRRKYASATSQALPIPLSVPITLPSKTTSKMFVLSIGRSGWIRLLNLLKENPKSRRSK